MWYFFIVEISVRNNCKCENEQLLREAWLDNMTALMAIKKEKSLTYLLRERIKMYLEIV